MRKISYTIGKNYFKNKIHDGENYLKKYNRLINNKTLNGNTYLENVNKIF